MKISIKGRPPEETIRQILSKIRRIGYEVVRIRAGKEIRLEPIRRMCLFSQN